MEGLRNKGLGTRDSDLCGKSACLVTGGEGQLGRPWGEGYCLRAELMIGHLFSTSLAPVTFIILDRRFWSQGTSGPGASNFEFWKARRELARPGGGRRGVPATLEAEAEQ